MVLDVVIFGFIEGCWWYSRWRPLVLILTVERLKGFEREEIVG
jgi:hypothetical protein